MKRGGLGGAILLAAAVIAVLVLHRPAPSPRAAPTETLVPPEPPAVDVAEEPPHDADVPPVVPPSAEKPGGTLSLVIRAEDGSIPEATVIIEPYSEPLRRVLETKSGATVEGLAPEWHRVRVVASGYAPVFLPVRIHPGGPVEASVVLKAGAMLVGIVRTEAGAPVAGVTVSSAAWDAVCSATTDSSGAYRIEHLPAGRVEMEARGEGVHAGAVLALEDGKEARWDPVVRQTAAIFGRVLEADGTPVARARVSCSWQGRNDGSDSHGIETDPAGAFLFDGCPDGVHVLSAWRPDANGRVPAAEASVRPSDSPVTITLRGGEAFMRGTVVDRNGAPATYAAIRAWRATRPDREVRGRAEKDGSFRLGPLPPGAYFVEVHLDGEPTLHIRPAIEIVANETLDLGVIRFTLGGRIQASVIDIAGGVLPQEQVEVLSPDGSVAFVFSEKEDGVFVTEELTPGAYLVRAQARGLLEDVHVPQGGLVTVELRVRAGGRLRVLATQADGQRVAAVTRIEDAQGRVLHDGPRRDLDDWDFLAEGEWRVIAVDERGRRAEAKIRMGREDQTIVLVLE